MVSVIVNVADYLANLGLEAGKKHLCNKVNEKKLHNSLRKFIECHRKYNDLCSFAEEIDFQGLVEYINNQLLDDVEKRIFSPSSKERQRARQNIVDCAVAFSKANTSEARLRVSRIISSSIDIIKCFYKKGIDKSSWLIASEIVDAMTGEINDSEQRIIQQMDVQQDALLNKIDAVHQALDSQLSPETFLNLAKQGNISGIEDRLKIIMTSINLGHPLAPDYGFDFQMKSRPLTAEAILKYPPKFECCGVMRMGKEIVHKLTPELFDYADRHQLNITLEVTEAKKLLGDIEDPSQKEAEELVGHTIIRKPREFPPAFPCSIKINGETVYKYVLLRTEEILDDGTYVVSNKEQQNCCIRIKVTFNYMDPSKKINYSMRIHKKTSNKEYLKFIKTMKAASEGNEITIYALEIEEVLMNGYTNPFKYESGFTNADEEIDFLSRVCDIEEYCQKQILIPEKIAEQEYSQVLYLSELIRGGENEFTWSSQTFQGSVTQDFRKAITETDNNFHELCFVGSSTTHLFNVDIEIPIMRKFKQAKIKDLDRFKRKLEFTDDNETISFTYFAGNDNIFVDKMLPADYQERQ